MADPITLPPGSLQVPATGAGTGPRAAKAGYVPDPNEKATVQLVEERINFSMRDTSRWALERQIFEVIAFSCGIQWIEYAETTRRFSRWNAPSWFPTPVTNLIAPRIAVMQAGLLRSEPQGRVRPNSSDAEDREAAKVAERLIGHFYDVTDEDMLRQHAANMVCLSGTVIAEDYWNPQAGKMLKIPRMTLQETQATEPAATCPGCQDVEGAEQVGLPCPMCGTPMEAGEKPRTLPDGSPAMEAMPAPELDETGQPAFDEMPEGELESRVRMLLNFYWDPKATSLKEARWCGEAVYVDLDWIDQNFPEKGPYISAEDGLESLNFYEASLLSLVGPSIQGTAYYGGTQYFRNGAVLRKYQEKPSAKYPKGRHLVIANGICLYEGDLPIQDEQGNATGDFTYTEFKYDLVPGRFAGRTPAEDMVPLQKRVNGIDSQVILNRKTLLNPWVLAPKGSGLNPGQVAMRPGATVLYNFIGVGAAPQVVQGVPLPEQVMQEREQAMQAMDALAQDAAAGVQAQMPQGVKSGIALNFIREQQQEMQIPRLKRWGLWISDRDRKRLLLAQKYYREPRAVKLLGEGSDWQVKYWKGADLRGNTDVSVDPGTLIPRSQSIQTQLLFDAAELGLVNPQDPMDRQRMLEALPLKNFETQVGPDSRRADKENAQMDDGENVAITPYDDHPTHLMKHIGRAKEPAFDYLTPVAQQAYRLHITMHQQAMAMADQQARQAMQQQQLQDASIAGQVALLGGGPSPNGNGKPLESSAQPADMPPNEGVQ